MKTLSQILAATAATAALLAFAAPASAAIYISDWTYNPGGSITVTYGDTGIGTADAGPIEFVGGTTVDPANNGVTMGFATHDLVTGGPMSTSTSFVDTFSFQLPTGTFRPSAISTTSYTTGANPQPIALVNMQFDSFVFNGHAGNTGFDINGNAMAGFPLGVSWAVLNGGQQQLVITGHGGGGASYAGTATFTPAIAVPEPTAWSLMILGFGGLGAMLRGNRRRALALG